MIVKQYGLQDTRLNEKFIKTVEKAARKAQSGGRDKKLRK